MGGALLIGGIVMWIIDAMKAPWEAAGRERMHSDPLVENG